MQQSELTELYISYNQQASCHMALLLGILLALTSLSSVTAIPLDDFYPFGLAVGDTALPSTDDGSSVLITLNREFPFYGRRQGIVVVSHLKHGVRLEIFEAYFHIIIYAEVVGTTRP